MRNTSWRRPAAIAGALLLAALVAAGCSRVYKKNYYQSDETPVVISYEGYDVQLEVQSRSAGYSANEDLFYIGFRVSHPQRDSLPGSANPTDFLEIDSVCVQPFKADTVICVKQVDKTKILDNYYNRASYLTRYQFGDVELPNINPFIRVSYSIRIRDPKTGSITAEKRFTQELKRFAYRAE